MGELEKEVLPRSYRNIPRSGPFNYVRRLFIFNHAFVSVRRQKSLPRINNKRIKKYYLEIRGCDSGFISPKIFSFKILERKISLNLPYFPLAISWNVSVTNERADSNELLS